MTEKRQYRTGKGRESETTQQVLAPGDADRMSILARNWNLPVCGIGGCTRVRAHDEESENVRHKGNDPQHPRRQHVVAPDGIAREAWFDRQEEAG